MPPDGSVAEGLDSDDKARRQSSLLALDAYLGELEPWAAAAWKLCHREAP